MSHRHDLKIIEADISIESHRLQVYKRIKQILKEGPVTYKSRWFWELLQNARTLRLGRKEMIWNNAASGSIIAIKSFPSLQQYFLPCKY